MVSQLELENAKGWIEFFFMLSILEAKTFHYHGFLEEHKVCENKRY